MSLLGDLNEFKLYFHFRDAAPRSDDETPDVDELCQINFQTSVNKLIDQISATMSGSTPPRIVSGAPAPAISELSN